jgi:chromosome segregation ATPase
VRTLRGVSQHPARILMNFENSGSDGEEGEQNQNKNQSAQTDGSGREMRAPEAASKRDVQEAERKAEEAFQVASEEVAALREEREQLEEEIAELRSLVEDHQEALESFDEDIGYLSEGVTAAMGPKSIEHDGTDAVDRAREKVSDGGDSETGA